jgi:flagellar basal body-associated protein FliL
MSKLGSLDLTTKIILIVLVVVISYLTLFLVLSEVFVQENTSWGGMMDHMNGFSPDYTVAILISLTVALVAGVLVTFWLKPTQTRTAAVTEQTD